MRVAEGVARYWDTRCARGRSWFPCFTPGGLAHPRASFILIPGSEAYFFAWE
jgi:hypothetical protein